MIAMTENARIKSTSLGYEGHGILTFYLYLEGAGWGCGFGGLRSDGQGLGAALKAIFAVLGVDSWEKVAGQLVRAKTEGPGGKVRAIGHIVENRWVTIEELSLMISRSGK